MTEYLSGSARWNWNADGRPITIVRLQRRVQHFAEDAVQSGRSVKHRRPHAAETIRDSNLGGVHRVPRCSIDDGVDAWEADVCRNTKHRRSTGSNGT
jgi:hypothetical protein